MFFITKSRHNKIVQRYADQTEEYRQALYRKDKMVEIVDLLATRTAELTNSFANISTTVYKRRSANHNPANFYKGVEL